MPSSNAKAKKPQKTTGLRVWMARVLEECDRASMDFAPDPVHDVRVALRRCRSLADGMIAMDPDPEWKAMKKAGRRLFQSLGELRDAQVMMQWVNKLSPAHAHDDGVTTSNFSGSQPSQELSSQETNARDPAAHALLEILARRETEQKRAASAALEEFDRKQWRQWIKILPRRASRVRLGSALFKHLALERWTVARELHQIAMRTRAQTAFHRLRIGIKRFRYIVENFLPEHHAAWGRDLKELQDILGDVHDLDVLWATAIFSNVFPDESSRRRWHTRILAERNARIDCYRKKMVGPGSLWIVWRSALPQGRQLHAIATRRMKLWARALDPDFEHSQRVTGFAMQLFEGLTAAGLLPATDDVDARATLVAAALLHDVGKSKKKSGHHKASFKLILSHGTPLGWKAEDLRRAAAVARYHRGALPTGRHKTLRDIPHSERKVTIQLAAVLRLANALDASHDGHIRRVRVETEGNGSDRRARTSPKLNAAKNVSANGRRPPTRPSVITIQAEGYSPFAPNARAIAAERHLLETVLRSSVLVKPLKLVTKVQRRQRPAAS